MNAFENALKFDVGRGFTFARRVEKAIDGDFWHLILVPKMLAFVLIVGFGARFSLALRCFRVLLESKSDDQIIGGGNLRVRRQMRQSFIACAKWYERGVADGKFVAGRMRSRSIRIKLAVLVDIPWENFPRRGAGQCDIKRKPLKRGRPLPAVVAEYRNTSEFLNARRAASLEKRRQASKAQWERRMSARQHNVG